MNKKINLFVVALISVILVLSACGKKDANDNEKEKNDNENVEVNENNDENEEENEEPEEEEEKEENKEVSAGDFSSTIDYMEEQTDGETKVLYENTEQQVHESDSIRVALNGYTLVELNDFHTDFNIPFDDQTDGGVLLAEYTIENTGDEDIYFMPDLHVEYPGTPKFYDNYDQLTPKEEQIKTMLAHSNDYELKAGEELTGYYAYPFSPEALDHIVDLSTVTVVVNKPHNEKGDVNSNFGKDGKFTLSLNEAGEEKASSSAEFYQDKATYDDMGEKKMLKEKSDIADTQELRDVKVTLDGYQFTEFIPNEVEAPRFESFTNGIALLTLKLNIENNGDTEVAQSSNSSKLTVDNSQYMLGEGMLLDYKYSDVIEAGESGELLQVFLLDLEQYEKIWKDKAFDFEIGPFRDIEGKDISKGNRVEFTLPN